MKTINTQDLSITQRAMIDETLHRGWKAYPAAPKGWSYYWIEPQGGERKLVRAGRVESGVNGCGVARDKFLSYQFLQFNEYKVPPFMKYTSKEEAYDFLEKHQCIVVKPNDAEQSKGVTVGIKNRNSLDDAVTLALQFSKKDEVVLQRQLTGKLYRVLVVNGRVFAAAYRRPAFVVGDGVHTVRWLIDEKNKDPLRSNDSSSPLKCIDVESVRKVIGDGGLVKILGVDEELEVLEIASISRGGEAQDVTEEVADSTVYLLEKITRELGLSLCGFDIMCDDISEPLPGDILPLLELNSLPGFKLHLYPTAGGISRNPAPAVLDAAFGK